MSNSLSWGGGTNASAFTGNLPYIWSNLAIGMPTGNLAANGNAPIRIESVTANCTNGHGEINYQSVATTGGTTFANGGGAFNIFAIRDTGTLTVYTNTGGGGTTYFSSGGVATAGVIPGSLQWSTVPTAPTVGTLTQNSPVSATLTWSAPASDGGSPVTGYRILYATNSSFTSPTTLDVSNVTSRTITGLTPGTRVWFKVAARNQPANDAGTSSVYSSSANVVLVADIGDLDGWASFGALPSGLTPVVSGALRRGSVYPLAGQSGLLREIQQTGSGAAFPSGTVGIRRTVAGLVAGKTYRLTGQAVSLQDVTPTGNRYGFVVTGIGSGTTIDTTTTTNPLTLPDYTFVATATSHVIAIQLQESTAWSGTGWWEAVGFYNIKLYEIPNTSPYRLQDTAYEGPLSTHYSYACDTVGAAWWVDRANVTQFRQADSQDTLKATFTDTRSIGKLEYVEISASYDTRNTINALTVNNHGRDASSGTTADLTYTASDPASVADWGIRSGSTDWTLRAGYIDNSNLIPNPSVETNATGFSGVGCTIDVTDTSWAASGTRSMNVLSPTAADSSAAFSSILGLVTPGKTYVLSATGNVKTALSGTGISPSTRERALVVFYRTGSGSYTEVASSQVPNAINTPTRVSVEFTLPVGTTEAFFRAHLGRTAGAIRWDAFRLSEKDTSAGADNTYYFDGTTAGTTDLAYEWTGTPHASATARRTFTLLNQRIAETISGHAVPAITISSIRWNAQEDPALAARLDIQDRIRVEFRGLTQDSRIVGLKHTITAGQWLIDIDLATT